MELIIIHHNLGTLTQWSDALIKGNTAGMAVGQPTFVT